MNQSICDYSDYDYKTDFWENADRKYEHDLESNTLHRIFKQYCSEQNSIIDAGCGFGRLFSTYQSYFSTFTLIDYAKELLEQAKNHINDDKRVTFKQQSLYSISVDAPADVLISIRTLHHLNDLSTLFQQFNQSINKNGILILDIPNKIHLKNRIKFLFKREQLFNDEPLKLSENFYNYNPAVVLKELTDAGFLIQKRIPIGLFRIPVIKKIIPSKVLIFIEKWGSMIISNSYLAPNLYVVAKKTVDNVVDN